MIPITMLAGEYGKNQLSIDRSSRYFRDGKSSSADISDDFDSDDREEVR